MLREERGRWWRLDDCPWCLWMEEGDGGCEWMTWGAAEGLDRGGGLGVNELTLVRLAGIPWTTASLGSRLCKFSLSASLRQALKGTPSSHRKFANPAPLGLCGFALTTFVLSLVNGSFAPTEENATKPHSPQSRLAA